ncbi:MarR family transcriptional regulator [Nocardioides immobilis]|uniref:MarR family transcriptional regulator n=1 Tax=Nocardioides immobilis TaxID=2049295 RepID=A0A417XY16_9ACTN|nr:MarR family transcriptional regulator [Nocardioides immobilis]RHW25303.1 MarR family transcriptional regulator [Nocardioides immobilis]
MNGDAPTSLAVRLRQAEAAIRGRLLPVLVEHGLSMEHWRIVAVVDDHPGIGMSSVAAAAVVPAATLTRHMDKLVELGLVVRHVDPADRRRVVVALSPRGRDLAALLRAEERLAAHPAALEVTGADTHLQVTG